MRRVALYGGSFDPPHVCHVLIASFAICRLPIDELRVIPVYKHAFGKAMAPYAQRVAMLEAALAHLGPRVRVDRVEERLEETSYTIDTVRALLAEEPDLKLTFLAGTDLFASRHRWKEWAALDQLIDFAVFGRDGEPDPPDAEILVRLPPISSTDVRRRIGAGEPVNHLIGPDVRSIISDHALYLS